MIKVRVWLLVLLWSTALMFLAPRVALAQNRDGWEVHLAPLYFWAATTSGNLAINGTTDIPIYLSFADAKSKVSSAFTLYGEAQKGRWGFLGDVNFLRLSSDANYTLPIIAQPVTGTIGMDQVIFNGKGRYEVKPETRFYLVGGIRTMTMSEDMHFTGPLGGQLADISGSNTDVAGVIGFIYRPKLGERFTLLTQSDIGGGSAFTWSAFGGAEFLLKPWIGLAAGYSALGINTGDVPKSGSTPIGTVTGDVKYTVKQYGPAFGLTFHLKPK